MIGTGMPTSHSRIGFMLHRHSRILNSIAAEPLGAAITRRRTHCSVDAFSQAFFWK